MLTRVLLSAPLTFRRVDVPTFRNYDPDHTIPASDGKPPRKPQMASCMACQHLHPLGSCPLKRAGVEYCGLCGLAHYGFSRICPHINSETQVREMIHAVKLSSEPGHLKAETLKYLTGLKGTLVQKKKKEAEKKAAAASGSAYPIAGPSTVPGQQPFHMV
jgi:chromodomain-helicase-DNA-binding protein 4